MRLTQYTTRLILCLFLFILVSTKLLLVFDKEYVSKEEGFALYYIFDAFLHNQIMLFVCVIAPSLDRNLYANAIDSIYILNRSHFSCHDSLKDHFSVFQPIASVQLLPVEIVWIFFLYNKIRLCLLIQTICSVLIVCITS